MEDLTILNKNTITSLELLTQINFFRDQEGNKTELQHNDLLKIIRDEFDEEIREGKITQSFYKKETGNGALREYPMYILTYNQAKQVLMRESKYVRKAVIKYIEQLEQQIKAKEIESQNKQILDIENRLKSLENKEKENKIINNGFMTVSEYAKSIGAYVPPFFCACLGKMATEKCVKNHIIIGKMYHSKYGSVNIYPVDLLESVFKDARIIIDYSEDEEIDF
jgi:hypothetical protein